MDREMQRQPIPPLTENPPPAGTGYLIIHVTTAGGAIPLEGAKIDVQKYEKESESAPATRGDTIASPVSGIDGNTVRIPLTAPPKILSESPGNGTPYALYTVNVTLDGYHSQSFAGIPIFDGITSIQPVILVPLPENGTTGIPRPDSTRFFEGMNPEL